VPSFEVNNIGIAFHVIVILRTLIMDAQIAALEAELLAGDVRG